MLMHVRIARARRALIFFSFVTAILFTFIMASDSRVETAHAATLSNIAPNSGSISGGQTITVNGEGFYGYIQEGLVAQFDGIDNTGTGSHSTNATTWKNLKNTGDVTLYNGQPWQSNGYRFNSEPVWSKQDYFMSTEDLNAAIPVGNDDRTLEYAYRTPTSVLNSGFIYIAGYMAKLDSGGGYGTAAMLSNNPGANAVSIVLNGLNTGYDYRISNPDSFVALDAFNSVSTPYHSSQLNPSTKAFVNGVNYPSDRTDNNGLFTCYDIAHTALDRSNCVVIFGNRAVTPLESARHSSDYMLMGYRIYNRTLSDAEVAQNLRMDQCRYNGVTDPNCAMTVTVGGQTCTNVNVVSDKQLTCTTPAYSGALDSGTSPSGVDYKNVDVVTTINGMTTTLTNGFTYYDNSISVSPNQGFYTGGDTITINGVGFTYKTSDYVQAGLVAQFDGINNTGGGDAAHSNNATTWKNLKGTGDLTLYNGHSWSNNGYRFNTEADVANQDYFQSSGALSEAIPAGNDDRTMEYAFMTPSFAQDNSYNVLAGYATNPQVGYGTAAYLYTGFGNNTTFAINGLTTGYDYVINNPSSLGTPNTFNNISTPYTTSQLNSGTKAIINGTNYSSIYPDNNGLRTCGDSPFTGVNRANCTIILGDRLLHDRHAAGYSLMSYRIYNRTLSDAEVAHNLRVDQCRFDAANNPDCLTVTIGSQPCTDIEVTSDTQLTCKVLSYSGALNSGTTPAGVKYKAADVAVTTDYAARTLASGYTYYDEYLALDLSKDLVQIAVSPTAPESSSDVQVTTATNNASGYTLYMVGGTSDSGVITTDNRLAYQGTPASYISSISDTGALDGDTWAYQFSSSQPDDGDTNWQPVPDSLEGNYGEVMQATTTAPIVGEIDDHDVWFGAKIRPDTRRGDYLGHVVWTLTANL